MFSNRLEELSAALHACAYMTQHKSLSENEALDSALFLLQQVVKTGGTVHVIGNGGSAGIASHFCNDLLKTLDIAANVFSDSNILTCFANDYGYENVYAEPLKRRLKPHDMVVAISSSGQSENIVKAAAVASEKKAVVMTLSGFDADNPLRSMGELNFWIDSHDYGIVETGHFFLLHTLIDTMQSWKQKSQTERLSESLSLG